MTHRNALTCQDVVANERKNLLDSSGLMQGRYLPLVGNDLFQPCGVISNI
jgi:hypothetical protein